MPAVLHEIVGISIASDYSTIPMTIHAAFFLPPSFGRRCPEGAEVGHVKRYSHIRGSQPRLASLVCPFQRKGREIVVIRGQGLALPPHMPRTSPLSSSLFHTASALSAPSGHLPLEGKADDTRETCHRKHSGIDVYKNRRGASLRLSLPRMGKGDRGAVDRVLS